MARLGESQVARRILIGAVFAIAAVILLYAGRDQVLRGNTIEYASRLSGQSLLAAMFDSPPDKYLFAVPMLLYAPLFELFGLGADLPYRLVATAFVLGCGALFLALARPRAGFAAALGMSAVLMLFGPGWDTLLTATRLSSLISVAAGLGALLALARVGPGRYLIATALLAVAVASHPGGLAYVAADAVIVFGRGGPRVRDSLLMALPSLLVLAVWLLFLRTPSASAVEAPSAGDVISFAWRSWVVLVSDVTGLSLLTPDPIYRQVPNELAGAVAASAILVLAVVRCPLLTPRFWGLIAALAITAAAPPLAPSGAVRLPDESRYLFPLAVLLFLALAELAPLARERRSLGFAAALVLAVGFAGNLDALRDGGNQARFESQEVRGVYAAYELAGERADPSYGIPGFIPTPREYRLASERFGSAAPDGEELRTAPGLTRVWLDTALVESIGIEVEPGSPRGNASCRRYRPRPGAPPVPTRPRPIGTAAIAAALGGDSDPVGTAPRVADLELRSGTISFPSQRPPPGVLIGRADDPAIDPVAAPATGPASLTLPELTGGRWRIQLGSAGPVVVCETPRA